MIGIGSKWMYQFILTVLSLNLNGLSYPAALSSSYFTAYQIMLFITVKSMYLDSAGMLDVT